MMTEKLTGHRLVVTLQEGTEGDPEYTCGITCLNPDTCSGWEECAGNHRGYDPESPVSSAYEKSDDVEIHGELHDWHDSYGWVVPFEGCIVASNLDEGWCDDGDEIAREHGAGTYEVDVDWYDDTTLNLAFVSRVIEDSPADSPGR